MKSFVVAGTAVAADDAGKCAGAGMGAYQAG